MCHTHSYRTTPVTIEPQKMFFCPITVLERAASSCPETFALPERIQKDVSRERNYLIVSWRRISADGLLKTF